MGDRIIQPPFYNSGFYDGDVYKGGGFYNGVGGGFEPDGYYTFLGVSIPYKKYGNLYWFLEDILSVPESGYSKSSNDGHGMLYNYPAALWLYGEATDNWRIPSRADWESLISLYPKTGDLSIDSYNKSNFSAYKNGYLRLSDNEVPYQVGNRWSYWTSTSYDILAQYAILSSANMESTPSFVNANNENFKAGRSLRFCKDS